MPYSLEYFDRKYNPNRGVPILKKTVPISELVRTSEVTLIYGESTKLKYVII